MQPRRLQQVCQCCCTNERIPGRRGRRGAEEEGNNKDEEEGAEQNSNTGPYGDAENVVEVVVYTRVFELLKLRPPFLHLDRADRGRVLEGTPSRQGSG